MAGSVSNFERDNIISAFREFAIRKWTGGGSQGEVGWVPFAHQRKWWAASDGLDVLEGVPATPETGGVSVFVPGEGSTISNPTGKVEWWATQPRPGGRARVIADLGAFKIGKSMAAGFWAAGFAAVPDARVSIVGLEYDICAPEFGYIEEILLSDRGLGLKYTSRQNRPRDGKMYIDLENGARYEAKSWERKDNLKGKEIDAYVYAEAYQLPGLEAYTDFSQNLRARQGYAVFPTTPDRPWVQEIHDRAHSGDPQFADWACVCSVDSSSNPFTYDAAQRERDKHLMTREKYAIHYAGKLGDYVGRVFQYQRGDRRFNPSTHPHLFKNGKLVIPEGWDIVYGADTGTYYSGLAVMFSPAGEAFVLKEWPNYRYTASLPERDESVTIPQWAGTVRRDIEAMGGRSYLWADPNSQFKGELRSYGLYLLASTTPVETRTEITREYFQHNRIWMAEGLSILPFELENAHWPEEATAAGKFSRVKDRDHTLDPLEHILSKRPRGQRPEAASKDGTWLSGWVPDGIRKGTSANNPHLGDQ